MPKIIIPSPTFFSPKDEDAFFAWLQSIPSIVNVVGIGRELHVTVRSHRVSDSSLRDLLALHRRYKLTMTHLAVFENPKNSEWFRLNKAVFAR